MKQARHYVEPVAVRNPSGKLPRNESFHSLGGWGSVIRVSDFDRFAFIVGAPRCGTTTLAQFLKQHPAVHFPLVKEPHFFSKFDLRALSDADLRRVVENEYLARFFADDGKKERIIGADGSVSYLYTPEQLKPILRLWPESRFIVALRDPLEMLPSLHRRLIYLGDETLDRFEDAWEAVPERTRGQRVPRTSIDPRWLRYDEAARFGTYLERLFEAVGRERCLVILFDDLKADPRRKYRQMMDFLGLPPMDDVDFLPKRRSYEVRYPWLQRLLKRPPKRVRSYLAGKHFRHRELGAHQAGSDGAVVEKVFTLRKRLLRWNRVPAAEQSIPIRLQKEIRSRLRDEVAHLERLTGRDLGHWLQPRSARSKLASPYE
jgi:hypothetical protein